MKVGILVKYTDEQSDYRKRYPPPPDRPHHVPRRNSLAIVLKLPPKRTTRNGGDTSMDKILIRWLTEDTPVTCLRYYLAIIH